MGFSILSDDSVLNPGQEAQLAGVSLIYTRRLQV